MHKHRGLAPEDTVFFDPERVRLLRKAVCDLSWLLRHSYAGRASLELVGNRYQLTKRERLAISHAAWGGKSRRRPETLSELEDQALCIDGFNLLITLETALGGGIILKGMDECYRDIANVHGSYTLHAETEKSVELIGGTLKNIRVKEALWLFDRPVSNSGRLAKLVNDTAVRLNVPMHAETADQVDSRIKRCGRIAVTTDSDILDSGTAWFDLAGWLIRHEIKDATIIDLKDKNGCEEY